MENLKFVDDSQQGAKLPFSALLMVWEQGKTTSKTFLDPRTLNCIYSGKNKEWWIENGFCVGTQDDFDVEYQKNMALKYPSHAYAEIDEETYLDALNCLPPKKWEKVTNGSIFLMSEYMEANCTSFYVKLKNRYFTCVQSDKIKYADVLARIEEMFFK